MGRLEDTLVSWNHIVIEGFCVDIKRDDLEAHPCSDYRLSTLCFGNREIGMCPYFRYTGSNEREAALFVPWYLIMRDKTASWTRNLWGKFHWYIWGKWHYDDSWIDKFPVVPTPLSVIEHEEKCARGFPGWLEKAQKE